MRYVLTLDDGQTINIEDFSMPYNRDRYDLLIAALNKQVTVTIRDHDDRPVAVRTGLLRAVERRPGRTWWRPDAEAIFEDVTITEEAA